MDVNETNDPTRAGDPGAPGSPPLFRAFQEQKSRRGRWVLLLVLPIVGLGVWGTARDAARTRQVVTPTGFRAVRMGMTSEEVRGVLGNPFASSPSRDGRAECYQYGHPTLEQESFPVYSLCYEAGKLREVTVRRFTAQAVGSDGFTPDRPAEPPPGDPRP